MLRKSLFHCSLVLIVLVTLTLISFCWQPVQAKPNLKSRLQAICAQYPDFEVGLSAIHIPSNERISLDGSRLYPLASVFKMPILVELARQLQSGHANFSLDSRLTITESNKCLGSGDLQYRPNGSTVSLRQAVELMITESDNTATDMIFDLIGTNSVSKLMQSLGLTHGDIFLKNRPAWLLSLGQHPSLKGKSPKQMVAYYSKLSPQGRRQLARQAEQAGAKLTMAQFLALENSSDNQLSHWQNYYLAANMDNTCSADDLAQLYSMLWRGQLLNRQWTDYCLGVLRRTKSASRIPAKLPKDCVVYHKTGTLAGISNDTGIIMVTQHDPVVLVALVQKIGANQEYQANQLIARVSRAVWEQYRP